jgi:hypothetical protein
MGSDQRVQITMTFFLDKYPKNCYNGPNAEKTYLNTTSKQEEYIMKTLVIHPEDPSTNFLSIIYEDMDVTLINDPSASEKEVIAAINDHDRIIMCGHGCPTGLFGRNQKNGLIVNKNMVPALREKSCIFIWCNADEFVRQYQLTGFYTGMFISEIGEASCFGIKVSQKDIDYSNELFAHLMKTALRLIDNAEVSCNLMDAYKVVVGAYKGKCPVIKFNRDRLYYNCVIDNTLVTHSHYNPESIEINEKEREFKEWCTIAQSESEYLDSICEDDFIQEDDTPVFYSFDEAYQAWENTDTDLSFEEWYDKIAKTEKQYQEYNDLFNPDTF